MAERATRAEPTRRRHRFARLAALATTVALTGSVAGPAIPPASAATATAASSGSGGRPYIVTLAAPAGDVVSFAEVSADLGRVRGVDRVTPLAPSTVAVTSRLSAAQLRALPGVASVETDRLLSLSALDPLEGGAWYLDNPASRPEAPTVDADIDATAAWAVSTGSGVVVAVADSGFDITHPDLGERWERNLADDCDDGIDDDDNGFTDDCRGWDFGTNDPDVSPGIRPVAGNGAQLAPAHGTQIAGIIAAARNGRGTVGVAPDSRILPIKVTDGTNRVWLSAGIRAMSYATGRGADVFVASWGNATGSAALATAVTNATAAGMVVVAAAGNGGRELGPTAQWYPAGYAQTNDGVISVAATNGEDELAEFSNHGAVTLAAPGVGLLTTTVGRAWTTIDGTSAAAPVVAGVVALLRSAEPTLTPAQVRARLVAGTDQPSGLVDAGAGRINAAAALGIPRDSAPATVDFGAIGPLSDGVTVEWSDPLGAAAGGVRFTVAGPTGNVVHEEVLAAGGGTATADGLEWNADHVVTLQPLPELPGIANATSATIRTPAAIPTPRVTVHATETAARVQLSPVTLRAGRILRYELRWPDRTTTLLPGTALSETVTGLTPNTTYSLSVAVVADTTAEGIARVSFGTAPTVAGPSVRLTPTVEGVDVVVVPPRSLPGRPPLTGYRISAAGRTVNISAAGRGTLRGLVPDVAELVTVTALHGTLDGTSVVVGPVTPYGPIAPDAPANLTASFQSSNLAVRWDRADGPLITGYVVSVNGVKTQVPASRTFLNVRVGAALSVDVEVTARNGWGTSPATAITVDR